MDSGNALRRRSSQFDSERGHWCTEGMYGRVPHECTCRCHDEPRRIKHILPCCHTCPICGIRIRRATFDWHSASHFTVDPGPMLPDDPIFDGLEEHLEAAAERLRAWEALPEEERQRQLQEELDEWAKWEAGVDDAGNPRKS